MLKTHITACLMATALVAAPALAQTGSQPAQPPAAGDTMQPRANEQGAPAETQATQPGTTEPNVSETTVPVERVPSDTAQQPAAPAADTAQQPTQTQTREVTTETAAQDQPGQDLEIQGGVIVQQSPNHVLANDLIGANVIGADDASIGSVSDLVLDAEHRVVGVIVGVGGFLGIGAKDVALPMADLSVVPEVDTTASTGAGDAAAREVEEIRANMTREQLEEAPQYTRLDPPAPAPAPANDPAAPGAAPGGVGGGIGTGGMGGAPATGQPN